MHFLFALVLVPALCSATSPSSNFRPRFFFGGHPESFPNARRAVVGGHAVVGGTHQTRNNVPAETNPDPTPDHEVDVHSASVYHAAVMAEKLLASDMRSSEGDFTGCIQRAYCNFAHAPEGMAHEKGAVEATVRLFERMLTELEPSSKQRFPGVARIAAAYRVGEAYNNRSICPVAFPCQKQLEGRSTCSTLGRTCPGIVIGCGLCGILSPPTCAAICPVAAITCGVTGYACATMASSGNTTKLFPGFKGVVLKPRSQEEGLQVRMDMTMATDGEEAPFELEEDAKMHNQTHGHGHGHGHGHNNSHEHGHNNSHEHGHNNSHGHGREEPLQAVDPRQNDGGHDGGEHWPDHEHDHGHEHEHGHEHGHQEKVIARQYGQYGYEHGHGHGYPNEYGNGHDHGHHHHHHHHDGKAVNNFDDDFYSE